MEQLTSVIFAFGIIANLSMHSGDANGLTSCLILIGIYLSNQVNGKGEELRPIHSKSPYTVLRHQFPGGGKSRYKVPQTKQIYVPFLLELGVKSVKKNFRKTKHVS